jgi:hypothetical protein
MVHDRISDEHHALQGRRANAGGGDRLVQDSAHLSSDELGQLRGLRLFQGVVDATHDVAAVRGLGVAGRVGGQDVARLEVDDLGDDGRGAEVHRCRESRARLELEGRVVAQDGSVELLDLESQRAFGATAAGEMPTLRSLFRGEDLLLVRPGGELTLEHLHAAAFAAATPPARKLHAEVEEHVAQRRAAFDVYAAARGPKLDPNDLAHARLDE